MPANEFDAKNAIGAEKRAEVQRAEYRTELRSRTEEPKNKPVAGRVKIDAAASVPPRPPSLSEVENYPAEEHWEYWLQGYRLADTLEEKIGWLDKVFHIYLDTCARRGTRATYSRETLAWELRRRLLAVSAAAS
jgi:hypothetical protein